jgi:MerR family copper efflux transcriptional regulator
MVRARELGFTLEELKQLALLFEQRQLSPREMAHHLTQKEQEIDARITQLQYLKADIQQALAGQCELREQLLTPHRDKNAVPQGKM